MEAFDEEDIVHLLKTFRALYIRISLITEFHDRVRPEFYWPQSEHGYVIIDDNEDLSR
jgi:hypothetical protein